MAAATPDIASLLAAQGGPPPGGGPMPGGPPDMGPPPDMGAPEGGGDTEVDVVRRMLEDAQSYLQISVDEEDNAQMAKIVPLLQALLAKDQKDFEQASQGTITPRLQRKMAAGAGAPPPGEMAAALLGGGGGPPPGGPPLG